MELRERLVGFVRRTLGCTCPEDVFQRIECEEVGPLRRVLVGKRLLIYIWEVDEADQVTTQLETLATRGIEERNENGWNRFRLVVAAAEPGLVEEVASAAFSRVEGLDDRVHLHVVPASQVEDLPRTWEWPPLVVLGRVR